jgi:hypothetical protein
MQHKRNNYALHYRAQVLADTNSKYSLARRIIELEDKIKEYEDTGVMELDADSRTGTLKKGEEYIKQCICGYDVSKEDVLIDSLYPANRERTEWLFGCMVHNGGCGRQVYANSKDDVVRRWNNGETDEYIK